MPHWIRGTKIMWITNGREMVWGIWIECVGDGGGIVMRGEGVRKGKGRNVQDGPKK
jgi:hypothetical protein